MPLPPLISDFPLKGIFLGPNKISGPRTNGVFPQNARQKRGKRGFCHKNCSARVWEIGFEIYFERGRRSELAEIIFSRCENCLSCHPPEEAARGKKRNVTRIPAKRGRRRGRVAIFQGKFPPLFCSHFPGLACQAKRGEGTANRVSLKK